MNDLKSLSERLDKLKKKEVNDTKILLKKTHLIMVLQLIYL